MQKQNFTDNLAVTAEQKIIIDNIAERVKAELLIEGSGHDWWHVERVWNLSIKIASEEQANIFICSLVALLHDIADHKFGYSDHDRTVKITEILEQQNVERAIIENVIFIINNLSYKSGKNKYIFEQIEARVVQDADRLDAIGAIGIARAFAYGGFSKRTLYNPTLSEFDDNIDTISHFYNKLLKLKDLMHTNYGKELAAKRHHYMETFLNEFDDEWNENK